MSGKNRELVPTRITDKNGRRTTVHKKPEGKGWATGSAAAAPASRVAVVNSAPTPAAGLSGLAALADGGDPRQSRVEHLVETWRRSIDRNERQEFLDLAAEQIEGIQNTLLQEVPTDKSVEAVSSLVVPGARVTFTTAHHQELRGVSGIVSAVDGDTVHLSLVDGAKREFNLPASLDYCLGVTDDSLSYLWAKGDDYFPGIITAITVSGGWDESGRNRETGTRYDPTGYDREGYDNFWRDREGYTIAGFDRDGIHRDTGTEYDERGYNRYGFDEYGLTEYGTEFNEHGQDAEGYDHDGKNVEGLTREEAATAAENNIDPDLMRSLIDGE